MLLRQPGEKCCRLCIVDIAHGYDLSALIFEQCAADNSAASAQSDDSDADAVIGSRDTAVGSCAQGCSTGGAAVKKASSIHYANAFCRAWNDGSMTFRPSFEPSSRSSSLSTQPCHFRWVN